MEREFKLLIGNKLVIKYSFIAGAIGSIIGFIENYVYSPAGLFFALSILVVADFATGVTLAYKRKEIETSKLPIFLYRIGIFTLIMFAVNAIKKHSAYLYWLDDGVIFFFFSVATLSILKNAHLLGWIGENWLNSFLSMLLKNVDKSKERE